MWPSKASLMMPQSGGGNRGGNGTERTGAGTFSFVTAFMSLYPSGGSTKTEALPPSVGLGVGSSAGYVDINQNERRVRRRLSSEERLQRNRERNRLHARKTRQRKKAHMTELSALKRDLENRQRQLRQAISDRKTAKILLVMSGSAHHHGTGSGSNGMQGDDIRGDERCAADDGDYDGARGHARPLASPRTPHHGTGSGGRVEGLERMDSEGHFDGGPSDLFEGGSAADMDVQGSDASDDDSESDSGNHHHVPHRNQNYGTGGGTGEGHSSGSGTGGAINYALLSKDRSLCTPEELEEIRRERNRMHARRTRERKKVLLQQAQSEIAELCRENKRLQAQLEYLDSVGAPNGHHLMLHHSTTGAASAASGGGGPPQRQDAIDGAGFDGLLGGTTMKGWHQAITAGGGLAAGGGVMGGRNGSSHRKTPSTLQGQVQVKKGAHAACRDQITTQRQGQARVQHTRPFKGDGSDTSSDSGTSEEAVTISESERSGSEGGNGSSASSSAGGNGRGKSSGED